MPVYPDPMTDLGGYAAVTIPLAAHQVVHAFAPLIPIALPLAVGYFALMWCVEWVLDNSPFTRGGLFRAHDGMEESLIDVYNSPGMQNVSRYRDRNGAY